MKYKIYTRNNNIIYFLTVLLMCDYALTCVIKGKTNKKKEKEMFILLFKSFFPLIMKNKSISNSSAYVILSFVEILCIQGRARITAGVKRRKVFVCGIALLI